MEELEIMRLQLESMKEQLRSQHIVNESLMRKVMKGKASWMNTLVKAEIICVPITWILFAAICVFYDMSQWYASLFLIMAAVDTYIDWYTVRIPPSFFGTLSMLDLKKYLLKQKKWRFWQVCIMSPLCLIWMIAFFYAMGSNSSSLISGEFSDVVEAAKTGGLAGGILSGVVGVVVMIILFRRMQRTNDTLISDINDSEKDA